MTLDCPVCKHSLEERIFNNVEVDMCRKGCGVWFDWGEMQSVEESDTLAAIDAAFPGVYTPRALKESMAEAPRSCPRHPDQQLQRFQWNLGSGLVFDKCPTCEGTWLDAGELEGYAMMVKKFRTAPPELTPEIQAKLEAAKAKAGEDFERALDEATQKTVDWDIWLFDDALRGLMKMVLSNRSSV